MTPERWEMVKSIFSAAVDLDPNLRADYVQTAAGDDEEVAGQVLSLLRNHSETSFLRTPAAAAQAAAAAGAAFRAVNPESSTGSPSPAADFESPDLFGSRIHSYRVLDCIGRGGMGVVYRALDETLGREVALKTLPYIQPAALHRFKQEFRAFADLNHPNLISLYELLSDGTRWCFTMELVHGRPFLAGLPSGPLRLDRLRDALRQLAAGVAALHACDKLHRDLKPSNVLITDDQRVVILDFGLGAELDAIGIHQSTGEHVFGSVAYMSPEQAAGGPVTAASDWYSVGVMLFEALTGRLPFEGGIFELLRAKQTRDAPAASSLADNVPGDLDNLCSALLTLDPAQRPGREAILAALGAPSQVAVQLESTFVGRPRELGLLRDAYRGLQNGKASLVYVHGESGAGKTALVQNFLLEARGYPQALVLTGRCLEHELVPFKALDNLVDSIVEFLRSLALADQNALMPRDCRALARLFPAFERVAAVSQAPLVGAKEMDPPELRRRAAAALRELLLRMGDRCRLVFFIDDLHWGDVDSASLLADILLPPDAPVLLGIVSYRTEDMAESAFLKYWQGSRNRNTHSYEEQHIELGQLALRETWELTHHLLEAAGVEPGSLADEIARESAGRPLLVYELVEHVRTAKEHSVNRPRTGLSEVLWSRIQTLPEPSRKVLEVVSIAGRPVSIADACQAAGVPVDERKVLRPLRAGRLIRGTPALPEQRIEVFHDRIRQLLLERMDAAASATLHRRFAEMLAPAGADAEQRAYHLHRGGLAEEAAVCYRQAATGAANALAFDHAARLYRQALELKHWEPQSACHLRAGLAGALHNAGRGREAAVEYLAAAALAEKEAALDLRHRAGLAMMTSGHVDEGLACLEPVMRSAGIRLAKAPWRALLSLLLRRLQLRIRGLRFKPCTEAEVAPALLRRIDVGWSFVLGLSVVDPIRGAAFQTGNVLAALRAGEPFRVARALAVEAGHLASSASPQRAQQVLAEAAKLASALDRPYARGMVELARGTVNYFGGDWLESLASCRRAAAVFRENCTGATWEVDTANAFALWSLAKTGQLAELTRISPALLKEAVERGDLYAEANLSTQIMALVRLAADDPESARQELNRAMGQWSQNGYHVQHHDALLALVPLELYCGNTEAAWNRVQAEWADFRWSLLGQIQDLRVEMLQLRSYCALAMAAEAEQPAAYLRSAAGDLRRLRAEGLPWTAALVHYIAGTLAQLDGDMGEARRRLGLAVESFDAIHAELHAAVTRTRLAELLDEDEARPYREAAANWFAQQKVRNCERMVQAYAPGFRARRFPPSRG